MTTLVLPETSAERMPAVLAVTPSATVAWISEMRRILPPNVISALEAISHQSQAEVCEPLVRAPGEHELAETFSKLFPVYWRFYVSSGLVLLGGVGGDQTRLFAASQVTLQYLERLLEDRASKWLGDEPAMAVLLALRTINRAARGMVTHIGQQPPQEQAPWFNRMVGYAMCSAAVYYAISGDEFRGRPENVRTLSYWCRGYSIQAYQIAKRLGALPAAEAPAGKFEIPSVGDEEDTLLADAGLAEYGQMLSEGERGAGSTG